MNENKFLLNDISNLSRSSAAKIITGTSTAGKELEDKGKVLVETIEVDLNSPLPLKPDNTDRVKPVKPVVPAEPPKEPLDELLYKFIDKYSEQVQGRKTAKTEDEKEKYKPGEGNWMYDMVYMGIPAKLGALHPLDEMKYAYKSSVGKGLWADCPWIAVFNKYITQSTQNGIYIVYLLNPETKELYLTLNQGTTQYEDMAKEIGVEGIKQLGYKKKEDFVFEKIKTSTSKIRGEVNTGTFSQELINTGKVGYDLGCVCSKRYTLDNLPVEEVLVADLKAMLDVYDEYYELHKDEYPSIVEKNGVKQMNTTDGMSVLDQPLL